LLLKGNKDSQSIIKNVSAISQNNVALAPLFSDIPPADFKLISEIDIGVQNYLIKCITNAFQDKFHYLPTHQHGLIIGGGSL
jgi:hypothetical protein